MQQHIAVAQGGENALARLAERGIRGGHERGVLQPGPVDRVNLPERREIEQTGNLNHVAGIHVEFAQQQFQHVLRHVIGDLEAHRRAEPAAGELALQRLEQILVAVLDVHVGVAGDPEGMVLNDFHAGEQHRKQSRDQLLHRQEAHQVVVAGALELDEPVDVVRDLDPREMLTAVLRGAHRDRQVQAQPADERERVGGVDGQRGQDREYLLVEIGR
jgi:hypothetical protein